MPEKPRRPTAAAGAIEESDLLALERRYCAHGDTVHYSEPPKIFDRCEGSFLFDNAPLRKRELFKNEIRRILTNDGSVKVYDDQRAHNHPFAQP